MASILETPPLTSCRRQSGVAAAEPNPISLGDPSLPSNTPLLSHPLSSHTLSDSVYSNGHSNPHYMRLAA